MKKHIISIMAVVAIALTAGWNVLQSEETTLLNDLAINNVEALACHEGQPCGYSNHGPTGMTIFGKKYCKNENNVGCSY